MAISIKDYAILEKFGFEAAPVGVKFLTRIPDNLPRLEENLPFCQMLKKAQEGDFFYADDANHSCEGGLYVLGRVEVSDPILSGEFGAGLKVYESPRSASRLYPKLPRMGKGLVKFVAFAPVNKLTSDPDLLVILSGVEQTEILLRAMSYRSGEVWLSRMTPVIGCAWIFIYPYLNGKLNYITTGLGHGMKRRHLFPPGRQIISIPFDLISSMLENLREMPWVLPGYRPDGPEYFKRLRTDLGLPL